MFQRFFIARQTCAIDVPEEMFFFVYFLKREDVVLVTDFQKKKKKMLKCVIDVLENFFLLFFRERILSFGDPFFYFVFLSESKENEF